jgi:hypothetical protein
MRFFSVHVTGSMTLTLPSSELSTNTGAGNLAITESTKKHKKIGTKILENVKKRIT